MLISLSSTMGYRLQANDGTAGRIADLYFDDQSWRLRYGLVNMGPFFSPNEVLIGASTLGQPDPAEGLWPVRLTREQIVRSPSSGTVMPVYRQEEERRRRFCSWPLYWEPSMAPPFGSVVLAEADIEATEDIPLPENCDPHLRSFREIMGYQIKALDGDIGVLEDFILDDVNLRVSRFVARIGGWFARRKVVLGMECVDRLAWAQRCIDLRLTRSIIEGAQPFKADAPVNKKVAARYYDYLGRPASHV